MSFRLLLDPAVIDKPAGAPASPAAAASTPAAPPAATAPATKTESASAPAPAADPSKPSPWMEPVKQEGAKQEPAAKEPEKKAEPEKFDLKVPEGASMDAAALAKFESSMKELGFDATQAQKILERDLAAQKASHEETMALLKSQDAASVKSLQAKWGTKFAERSESVKRAFDYADPTGAFRKKLADSYLANNPDLIEFVEKFGGLMKEDSIAAGPNAAKAGKDNRPLQERSKDAFTEFFKKGK